MSDAKKWTGMHSFGLLLIVAGIVLFGVVTPPTARLWSWLATMGLLAFFGIVAGHGVTGDWRGLLIDERNKMSLSRLQMVLWTVVVLSGFLAAALANLASRSPNPLSIAVPTELWLLMGISTTSLVGSPLVRASKGERSSLPSQRTETYFVLQKQGVDTNKVATRGQLIVNLDPRTADWADLFRGEEVGNAAQLDLGKIQMFFFTVVLVLAYLATLGGGFSAAAPRVNELPALDLGMVTLLAISHAGYLTTKAVPHTKAV